MIVGNYRPRTRSDDARHARIMDFGLVKQLADETVLTLSNRVVGTAPEAIAAAIEAVWAGPRRVPERPPLWDGHAATRIAEILAPR